MKIACSSVSFARSLADGGLTQLEWLDICANELEVDGVVFDIAHFPRHDAGYLAQLKKLAADLGLTVAALAADDVLGVDCERYLQIANELGAPLAIASAPAAGEDPRAWGDFTDAVKHAAGAAKFVNITLAVRNARSTLCASGSDLKRLAKDVDSAWLRYALSPSVLSPTDTVAMLLAKTVIAAHAMTDLETFATAADQEAAALTTSLARFRGFTILEATPNSKSPAYHEALQRYTAHRTQSLIAR